MRTPGVTREKGIIAWFAANSVAANLLMILIIVGGLMTVGTIRKETQPALELNMIQVRVPYLGAAPQEVEEGVVIKVEEAIQDIPGIVEINDFGTDSSMFCWLFAWLPTSSIYQQGERAYFGCSGRCTSMRPGSSFKKIFC